MDAPGAVGRPPEVHEDRGPWFEHRAVPWLVPVLAVVAVWLVPYAVRLGELAGHWAWHFHGV